MSARAMGCAIVWIAAACAQKSAMLTPRGGVDTTPPGAPLPVATPSADTSPSSEPPASSGSSAATADAGGPPGSSSLPPLAASAPFVPLAIEGHGAATVAVPLGVTSPQPVVVATHGNYDRADWACQLWRDVIGPAGFVLCPAGVARGDSPARDDLRYHYLTNLHLEREIEAALAALRTTFEPYVAPPPYAYVGFSQGAIMGVEILARRPEWFTRVVLIEGGFDRFTAARIRTFATAGGQRLLFACGQWDCAHGAKTVVGWCDAQGVPARSVFARGAGHTYGGAVAELIWGEWSWFVADEPRWTAARTAEVPH